MHDTTSTPALVDIAAMRDALAEAGVDPSLLNPVLPVDVSVDHSLAVEAFAQRRRAADQPAARDPPQRASATASCAGPRRRCTACTSTRPAPGSCTPSTWSSWPPSSPPRRATARRWVGARHDDRHRQPHADGQRHRRARLGRRRARSADGDVRHADHAAHPRRDRRAAHRRAAARACWRPTWR